MKHFNKLIQEKVNSYEYPYQEGSWESLQRKMKFKKLSRWGIATLIFVTAITSTVILLNNDNKEFQDRFAKTSISMVQINKSATKNEESHLNKDEKSKNHFINHKIQSVEPKNENSANSTITSNDGKENVNNNIQNISPVQNQMNTNSSHETSINFKKSVSQGCAPLKVQFNSLYSNKDVSYIWNFGDGFNSNESNPLHEYKKGGKYRAQLTVKNNEGNVISSEYQEVQVYEKPMANFDYKIENNCIVLHNLSKQSSFVQWKINDTTFVKEETNYCFLKSGKYSLQLTVENNLGCSDSVEKTVELVYKLPVQFADAFTPDGDGINDLFGPIVADYNQYEFKMFIYNKEGKCIYKCLGSPINWDGTDQSSKQLCPSDLYFYKVIAIDKSGNKNEFSGKINLKR